MPLAVPIGKPGQLGSAESPRLASARLPAGQPASAGGREAREARAAGCRRGGAPSRVAPGPGVLRWPAQAQAGSLIEAGIFAFVEARRGHWHGTSRLAQAASGCHRDCRGAAAAASAY